MPTNDLTDTKKTPTSLFRDKKGCVGSVHLVNHVLLHLGTQYTTRFVDMHILHSNNIQRESAESRVHFHDTQVTPLSNVRR